jgi:hypothetical protein
MKDLLTGETLKGTTITSSFSRNRPGITESSFEITIKPHSYRVFQTEPGNK